MKLADQPAVIVWPELKSPGSGQKIAPVQHRMNFPTLRAAANYGARELPEIVRRNAIIEVADTPSLNWETWRAFCDVPDEPHKS